MIKLVHARGAILTDAWLTETGHRRPGMNKGLPLAEAQAKAAELEPKGIHEAAAKPPREIRERAGTAEAAGAL